MAQQTLDNQSRRFGCRHGRLVRPQLPNRPRLCRLLHQSTVVHSPILRDLSATIKHQTIKSHSSKAQETAHRTRQSSRKGRISVIISGDLTVYVIRQNSVPTMQRATAELVVSVHWVDSVRVRAMRPEQISRSLSWYTATARIATRVRHRVQITRMLRQVRKDPIRQQMPACLRSDQRSFPPVDHVAHRSVQRQQAAHSPTQSSQTCSRSPILTICTTSPLLLIIFPHNLCIVKHSASDQLGEPGARGRRLDSGHSHPLSILTQSVLPIESSSAIDSLDTSPSSPRLILLSLLRDSTSGTRI